MFTKGKNGWNSAPHQLCLSCHCLKVVIKLLMLKRPLVSPIPMFVSPFPKYPPFNLSLNNDADVIKLSRLRSSIMSLLKVSGNDHVG